MLHVLLIAVFGALALREQAGGSYVPPIVAWWGPGVAASCSMAMLAAVLGLVWVRAWATGRALDRRGDLGSVSAMDTTVSIARVAIVVIHFINLLAIGWLDALRAWGMSAWVFDQVLAITPALLALAVIWRAVYPVERRLRDAMVLQSLDAGTSIHTIPSAGRFVMLAVRHQMLPVIVPGVLVMMLHPVIEHWANLLGKTEPWREAWGLALQLATLLVLMAMLPIVLTKLWSTEPLASGPVSDRLMRLCAVHRVRIRRLLVWKTDGTMVNGAVIGFVGWARYILLTDELLERLPSEQVEAVMAHEVAHVRRHHIAWLVVTLFAGLSAGTLGCATVCQWVWPGVLNESSTWGIIAQVGVQLIGVMIGVLAFGYVSRRFEWQADAFAAAHLSRFGPQPSDSITSEGSGIMIDALARVALLNHIPIARFTFRHGSISTRMRKLRELSGTPIARLRIDRVVRRIKLIAGVVLLGVIALVVFDAFISSGPH